MPSYKEKLKKWTSHKSKSQKDQVAAGNPSQTASTALIATATQATSSAASRVSSKDPHEHARPSSVTPVVVSAIAAATTKSPQDYSRDQTLLWREAYEALKGDEETKKLAETYENCLKDPKEGLGCDDVESRETPDGINEVLQLALDKTANLDRIQAKLGAAFDVVLSVKDTIGSALSSIPIAAAAWIPICITLSVLSKSSIQSQANLDGAVAIVKKMKWYSKLSLLLLENRFEDDQRHVDMIAQLANAIRDLYKQILEYLMETIQCHLENQLLVAVKRVLVNWNDRMSKVSRAEQRVIDLSQQYHGQQTNAYFQSLLDLQINDRQSSLLTKLAPNAVAYEMELLEKRKDQLLPDSVQWIIRDKDNKYQDFLDWAGGSQNQVLWIKGDAGMGKTMLLIGLIREMQAQFNIPLLSYFFCQGTDNTVNTATSVLKGLMWMLLCQNKMLVTHLEEAARQMGDQILTDTNAFVTLSKTLIAMILDKRVERVMFVVDALDECKISKSDPDLDRLLQFIRETTEQSSKVKWLVSGRKIDTISRALVDPGPTGPSKTIQRHPGTTFGSIELNREAMAEAIKAYTEHKIHDLRSRYSETPEPSAPRSQKHAFQEQERILNIVADEIRAKSGSTFLWVALVFRELSQSEPQEMLQKIKEIPTELKELYDLIIERIRQSPFVDSYKRMLLVVIHAYRPLSISELMMLSESPVMKNETRFVENSTLITVRENTVFLLHQTTKDFLAGLSQVQGGFFQGSVSGHGLILKRSLLTMELDLPNESYRTEDPSLSVEEILNAPVFHDHVAFSNVQYSVIYWIDHLCEIPKSHHHEDFFVSVSAFFEKHLLEWLIALALLRQYPKGFQSLQRLLRMLHVDQQGSNNVINHGSRTLPSRPSLLELVKDIDRFMRFTREGVEDFPLQAYTSALLFSPTESLIRKLYEEERLSSVIISPMQANWDSCLQIFSIPQGLISIVPKINSFFCSHGNRILVTNWNDGSCSLDFEATYPIQSMAFSRDGSLLALVTPDRSVEIWDRSKSVLMRTIDLLEIEEHTGPSKKLTNKKHYGLGDDWAGLFQSSSDMEVKQEDGGREDDGEGEGNRKDHKGADKIVDEAFQDPFFYLGLHFCSNGDCLAMSHNTTVLIWDLQDVHNIQCKGRIESGCDTPHVIHSSFNEVYFATSSSIDGRGSCTWLWNTRSGLYEWNHYVHRFAIDPMERQLAFVDGSRRDEVLFWDIETKSQLSQVIGVRDCRCMAFSSDGELLAIMDEQKIRVYNFIDKQYLYTTPDVSLAPFSISFLAADYQFIGLNGAQLGSNVTLWDFSGICKDDKMGSDRQDADIESITVSRDGSWILTLCQGQIKMWNAEGICLGVPEIRKYNLPPVIASNADSFVSASSKPAPEDTGCESIITLKTWDRQGNPTFEVEVLQDIADEYFRDISSIAISSDGKMVALAYGDKIQIWHVDEGTRCRHTFSYHPFPGLGSTPPMTFSMDGQFLAITTPDRVICVWTLSNGSCRTIKAQDSRTHRLALDPTGHKLASLTVDRETFRGDDVIEFLNVKDGRCQGFISLRTMHQQFPGWFLELSYDGEDLILLGKTWTARLTGAYLAALQNKAVLQITGAGISSDRHWITWDGNNILWLPPAFRPSTHVLNPCDVCGPTAVYERDAGGLLFFTFPPDFKSFRDAVTFETSRG